MATRNDQQMPRRHRKPIPQPDELVGLEGDSGAVGLTEDAIARPGLGLGIWNVFEGLHNPCPMAQVTMKPRVLATDKKVVLTDPTTVAMTDAPPLRAWGRWNGLVGQPSGGYVSGTTDQLAPFGSVRFYLGSIDQVNCHMRGFMAEHLDEQLARRALESRIQANDPGCRTNPTQRPSQTGRELHRHHGRQPRHAPKPGPAGQNSGGIERVRRHGLVRGLVACQSVGDSV